MEAVAGLTDFDSHSGEAVRDGDSGIAPSVAGATMVDVETEEGVIGREYKPNAPSVPKGHGHRMSGVIVGPIARVVGIARLTVDG
jgi:hypothetical protein